MHVIPYSLYPFQFFASERTQVKRAQGLFHLVVVFGPAHADINRGMGEDKTVAVAAGGWDFPMRHLFGIQELAPARGRVGDKARSDILLDMWKDFILRPPVGGIIANMKDVKDILFDKLGKKGLLVTGHSQEPKEAFLLHGNGAIQDFL